jgi:hypothetical protein
MSLKIIYAPLSLVCFFSIVGCVSSSHEKEISHLTKPVLPQQGPTVVPSALPPPVANIVDNSEKMSKEFSSIENAFLSQNCDDVILHTRAVQTLNSSLAIQDMPPFVQAAIYTCDARSGLADPVRLQAAVSALKASSLRYPLVNEPWLHNTLGDFYVALKDIPNALEQKKQARDLLLAQQQDISSLNDEIFRLDPASADASQSVVASPGQSVDQTMATARQLINNDTPDQAIALLDTISSSQKNQDVKKLRSEAVHSLVTNLRFKVRALFVRSTEQTGDARRDSLKQCEEILSGIIKNYPDYSDMSSVLNNLKQVQRELKK